MIQELERDGMTVTAPHPTNTHVLAEALFREARRRRRRRLFGWLVISLVAAVAATVSFSVFVHHSSGDARQITASKGVAPASIPKEIVAWMGGRVAVVATNSGGVVRTLATNVSVFAPGLPSVSVTPDGMVFFDSTPRAVTIDGHPSQGDQIFSVPIVGGRVRDIAAGSDPEVSPNGRLLAFIAPDPTGEAPYLVSKVGIDIATLSSGGSIDKMRALAPSAAQLNQGASDLSWSPDSRQLSFILLNPSTNVTTSWTISTGGDVQSLAAAHQIQLRQPGLSWNGFWGSMRNGTPRGIGILTSTTGSQEVVTINPATGQVTSRLFKSPATVCTSTSPTPASGGCSSDFSDEVVGDRTGTGVLLAGVIPFADGVTGISPEEQYLYIWNQENRRTVRLARQVLVAAWGPS
jgi:hypothetical protein